MSTLRRRRSVSSSGMPLARPPTMSRDHGASLRSRTIELTALAAMIGCACGGPSSTRAGASPSWTCASKHVTRVVDPAGAPVVGAQVRVQATYRQCGPSGLPEGCTGGEVESPIATTDASGTAMVCSGDQLDARLRDVAIIVEYRDWPRARTGLGVGVPWATSKPVSIMIGPPREATAEFPIGACDDVRHVHVTAHGEGASEVVPSRAVPGAPGVQRFLLTGLGPWRYWVQSDDDRSGNRALQDAACASYARVLDTSMQALVLDRSDAGIDRPDFAKARARVTAVRSDTEIASVSLDDAGRATIPLPEGTTSGSAFCLRLDSADRTRCAITFARAGEVARPAMYVGREREIAASCGSCSAPAP